MTARAEATLIGIAAAIAGLGVGIVTYTAGDGITIDALAAFATQFAAFTGLFIAMRRWAPSATRLLLAPVSLIAAIAAIEVFRIDPDLGRLQRWWLLLGAAIAMAVLFLLRHRGVEVLRRFRYLFLVGRPRPPPPPADTVGVAARRRHDQRLAPVGSAPAG